MEIKSRGNLVTIGMILGGLPLSAAIYLFFDMVAARQAGHPYGGDALGLMMMSLLAYAIAGITCCVGTIYFGAMLVKHKSRPELWQGIIFTYSLAQILLPIIYFSS